MKINELLVENEQLDELNLKGLGTGLGKALGGAAGGVVQGAKNIWSGMKQGYSGAQQALSPDDAGGTAPATNAAPASGTAPATNAAPASGTAPATNAAPADGTTPAQQPTTPATNAAPADGTTPAQQPTTPSTATGQPALQAEPAANPAAEQQSKVGVGQINKIIPTLRTRDLNSVKKTVDATLAKKQKQPTAPAAGAAPAQPTQAELDADHERLATGTNESKVIKFKSRFLGMDI